MAAPSTGTVIFFMEGKPYGFPSMSHPFPEWGRLQRGTRKTRASPQFVHNLLRTRGGTLSRAGHGVRECRGGQAGGVGEGWGEGGNKCKLF